MQFPRRGQQNRLCSVAILVQACVGGLLGKLRLVACLARSRVTGAGSSQELGNCWPNTAKCCCISKRRHRRRSQIFLAGESFNPGKDARGHGCISQPGAKPVVAGISFWALVCISWPSGGPRGWHISRTNGEEKGPHAQQPSTQRPFHRSPKKRIIDAVYISALN